MEQKELKFYRTSPFEAFNRFLMVSVLVLIFSMLFAIFLKKYQIEDWKTLGYVTGFSSWLAFAFNYWKFWKNTVYSIVFNETTFTINEKKSFAYSSIIKIDERLPYGFYLWGTNYLLNFLSADKNPSYLEDAIRVFNRFYRHSYVIEEGTSKISSHKIREIGDSLPPTNEVDNHPSKNISQDSLYLLFVIPLLFLVLGVLGAWLRVDPYLYKAQIIQRSILVGMLLVFCYWFYHSLRKSKLITKPRIFKMILFLQFFLSCAIWAFNIYFVNKFDESTIIIQTTINNPSVSGEKSSRTLATGASLQSKVVMINGKVHEEIQISDDYQLVFLISNSHNITLLPSYGIGTFSNF